MTTKEKRILGSWIQKYAADMNNAPLRNLETRLTEVFEENEGKNAHDLGHQIGDVILGSHLIAIQEHQLSEFYAFWVNAVNDIKA